MCPSTRAGWSLFAVVLFTGAAEAQAPATHPIPPSGRRELVGIVKDPSGVAVEGATVEVLGASVRTDIKGAFRLFTPELDTATIAIRKPGYSPMEALISARNRQWDTVMVELENSSTTLAGVRIEEDRGLKRETLRGFEERVKQNVAGLFITRQDILERNSLRLSDVLQTRRGIRLQRIGVNRVGVRFVRYSGPRSNCIPDLWIDGQRARGMEVDDISANTVEGMELYDSFAQVPSQFSHTANTIPCGTIVIWTRPPGTKRP